MRLVWADGVYKQLTIWVARWRPVAPVLLKVVERAGPGFVVLKRRWVIEQTFGWLGRVRSLSNDDEKSVEYSKAFVNLAMIHLMPRRLAGKLK